MESCYYELNTAPDFTLSKYAALAETGPSGVLTQHRAFWRQINQWGKLFRGSIHLIYQYDPERWAGQRMKAVLRFEAPSREALECLRPLMRASALAPYYDQLRPAEENCLSSFRYAWQVNLLKKERFLPSDINDQESFYTVGEWKMNESGRLYSMMRLMAAVDQHCVYCVDLYPVDYIGQVESNLSAMIPRLRELNAFKVKTGPGAVSSGGKDENAKKALEFYNDLMDELNASPHFLVNVQVLGEGEGTAKQVLDAAAAESLSEGSHELYSQPFNGTVWEASGPSATCWSAPDAPESLLYLPHLYTLEQIAPFALLPVLYSGETVEMPKETAPMQETGMKLGTDSEQHDVCLPWKNLVKHAFLAGMPGSGKTNAMMYLVCSMYQAGIPVLILEPAKREYRVLATLPEMEGLSLFSPSANSMFPIHINPFEFPVGMKLSDHINRLLNVFNGTFQLDAPMPMLLKEGIQACYEELLWLPGMVNMGMLEYPTMTMLYDKIKKLLDKYQYAEDVRSNLESILQVRIGSLMEGEMGDVFDVERSTFRPEEWLTKSAVIELASLGTAPTNFMMLMLMTLIRESLDIQVYRPDADKKPRHVIFLEEAHNLIANTSVQQPGALDPKVAATALVKDMLAEVRALGESIIIADQLPTAMAPEVIKNTSLKLGLRLTSQDERELLGSTMSADSVQMERMAVYLPGECLAGYEGLLKPFEMRIPKFEQKQEALDDEQVLELLLCNTAYHDGMQRSAEIMEQKFRKRMDGLERENGAFLERVQHWDEWLCTMNREHPDGKASTEQVKRLNSERKEIEEQFRQVMGRWCRLTLEAQLYMGVTKVRENRLEKWQASYTPEEQRQTQIAHARWMELIHTLYKQIQSKRKALKDNYTKYGFRIDQQQEQQLLKQQQIIIAGWNTRKE